MSEDNHLIGVFNSTSNADLALEKLSSGSIPQNKLSMLVNDSGKDHHFKVDENKSKTAQG